jgi:hypothetical protein
MITDLETRLRTHFATAPFRPAPGWEGRVASNPGLASPSLARRRALGIASRRLWLSSAASLAVFSMALVITAMPAVAGPDIPAWAAGLRTAIHIDSAGGDRATSWGTTMELVGAYLDDQHTIVVLKGDDANVALNNAYLAVSGRRYKMQQGVSGDDGYYALKFEPVTDALSSSVSVSLRLVDGLALPPHVWTLTFTIGPRVVGSQSAPAPGRAGGMAITFNSVSAVPGALAIRFTEVGLTYDQVLGPVQVSNSDGIEMTGRGPMRVRVQAFDRAGQPLRWLDSQLFPAADGSASVSFSYVFLRTGLGPYKVVINGPNGSSLERIVGP